MCQVLFSFHDSPLAELDFGGCRWSDLKEIVSNGSAKFDLNIVCIPRSEQRVGQKSKTPAGGITVAWEYNTDLFDDATAARMMGHFETLLRAVVADPERPVSSLPLLTAAEERQIRVEFNDTRTDYPRTRTVAELFEAQVEKTPEAPAVVSDEGTLTYAELNRTANRLAHHLTRLGVGENHRVGVCLDRSPDLIAGLLGILKAGAAYVPIDASYPRERISFLLSDAAVSLVLTDRRFSGELPSGDGVRLLRLDADRDSFSRESDENPKGAATADSLAYVMYTSGSTGRPKGVCIPHRGVVRLAVDPSYVHVTPEDTFLQFASVSFDASTFEIWGALLNGARLALMPPGVPSLEELGGAIERRGVTILWLTAGLFHQMVDAQAQSLRGVRQLIAGGDAISQTHARALVRALPGTRLINGYGPTENTTFTCCYPVTDPDSLRESVPIGRPIANTRVYLLDGHSQLVPIGVPGELHAGGDGLAREYLNRPALTSEKFIPDPFDPAEGARLYRTGDIARYRADGNIEFLGREDSQVKVRGYRIELGEVETALKEHPGVRDAVVTVDGTLEKRLFAYFVPAAPGGPLAAALRRHLAAQLPEYMIPSGFIPLTAMPLTANGKVDRAALPAPDQSRPELEELFVAPRNPVEQRVAGLWAQVLGLEIVGVHDNFFNLGGHSLLATQVISRVGDHFAVELPLSTLFQYPTVAEFAQVILERPGAGASTPIVRLDRDSHRFEAPDPTGSEF